MKENFKKTKKRFLPLMSALALAVRIAVTENLKKIPNHMKQKTIVPALPFLLPSLFGVGVFYAVPFAVSVFFTFTQGVAHPHFAGLQNFRELWGTAVFRQALGNTVLFLTVGLCLDVYKRQLNHLASLLGSVLGGLLCALGKLLSFLLGSSFRLHGVGGGADLLLVTVHAADSMRGSFNGVCLFFGRQSLLLCGTVIRGVCRLIYTCFFPASRCRGGMA